MVDDAYVPLRLPGSPSRTHIDYLRLEDALNALGRQEFAAEWGRLPGWSQMPFRWLPKARGYVRHEMRLFGRRARLQRLPVTLELTKAEKQTCIKLYRKIRKIIREALEAKKLHAHAMHYATGEQSPITALCVWRKQAHPIFFTGRMVIRDPDRADCLADVVFERKLFERWLKDRRKAQAKAASVKMLRNIGAAMVAHAQQHKYEITRDEAQELVIRIAGEHEKNVTIAPFKEHVWKQFGATPGRKEDAQKARFTEHKADLEMRLSAVIGGASKT